MNDFVETCWAACERYPGLAQVIVLDPKTPIHAARQMQALVDQLGQQGITSGQALFALDFLGDMVLATHIGIEPYRQLDTETLHSYAASANFPFELQENWTKRGNLDQKVRFIIAALATDWPELS